MDTVLKLRELRRLRGLRQIDVARLSGIGAKTLSSFETSARIGAMKLSQLAQLLRVYDLTEEQFFGRDLEELLDPDASGPRQREAQLVARLHVLPAAARDALLQSFELMIESAFTLHATATEAARAAPRRATTTCREPTSVRRVRQVRPASDAGTSAAVVSNLASMDSR